MSIGAISGSSVARLAFASSSATGGVSSSGDDTSSSDSSTSAVQSAYVSPIIKFDSIAKMAVLYFRDGDSGEIYQQIPAEKVVKEYRLRGGRSIEETPVVANARAEAAARSGDASVALSQTTTGGASEAATVEVSAGSSGSTTGSSGAATTGVSATETGSVGSTLSVSV